MKKIILLFSVLAAIISCNKENTVLPEHESTEIVIHAYAPGSLSTKSVLDDNGVSVLWEDGDQIKVALSPNPYMTGSVNSALISDNFITTLSSSSQNAYFVGYFGYLDTQKYRHGLCLYPNTVSYSASKKYDYGDQYVTESISHNLPSEQIAGKNGSFGKNYNLASAYIAAQDIKDGKVPNVLFTNACGLIKIILPESASDVTSIKVSSNSGTNLTGNATLSKTQIDWDYDSSLKNEFTYRLTSPNFAGEGLSEVTLTNNGEAFTPGIEYNIVVWPGSHASGLTFTFTNSVGAVCEKTTSSNIVLEASKFDKFEFKSSFDFEFPAPEYVVTEEIQVAGDLIDGETYVIAWNYNQNNCLSNNNGDLILKSCESSPANNTYSEDDVFVFNKKSSTLNGADKYNSKSAATFMSVSTGLYIDSSLHINATAENALEFVVANLWSGNVGSRMDVWRNQSGDKLYLYYGTSVGTAKAETAEAHYHQEGRKWNFYKVERK